MSQQSRISVAGLMIVGIISLGTLAQSSNPSWQDISPSGVAYGFVAISNYGICGFAGAMPDQPKTLYIGTCVGQGIWKSTNGGTTWFKASTGTNGNQIDGRNWSVAVDPTNSDIVYTNCGFGSRQGIWKSTDGGVDWTQIQGTIDNNDIQEIVIDPLNHLHLLATEHSGNYSLWESLDGGASWSGKGSPWGSHSGYVFFLGKDDNGNPTSNGWLGMSENNGLWRTLDGGAHWTQVSSVFSRSHAGAGLYRASGDVLYGCVNNTVARSTDNGKTWSDLHVVGNLPNTCDGYSGIVSDGTSIWTMPENTGVAACGPYKWLVSPESGNGTSWTAYNGQTFNDGPGEMLFDATNRIVYANLQCSGIWKLQMGATSVKAVAGPRSISSDQPTGVAYDLRGRLGTAPVAAKAVSGIRCGTGNVYIVKMSNGALQRMAHAR